MPKPIDAPATFIPQTAICFGAAGSNAIAVDQSNALPVESAAEGTATAGIAAGTALSAAIDLGRQRAHRITLPAGWTAAALSFQASEDGTSWQDLYDLSGEVVIGTAIAAGGRTIVTDAATFFGIRYLKLRSGTAAAPVNQSVARTITLATVAR